jgi:hypothetical protein
LLPCGSSVADLEPERFMKLAIATLFGISMIGSASAAPFVAPNTTPVTGQAYVYTATATGGTGTDVLFEIPKPPNATYSVSWIASFTPQGKTKVPVEFSCLLLRDGDDVGQTISTDIGLYNPSVSGQVTVKVIHGTILQMGCGISTGASWTWAVVPLRVTLARLAGAPTTGSLTTGTPAIGTRSAASLSSQSGFKGH